ncbi:fimbrial biogenesis chaperone [Stenotrophomonas maltophilia]|uniref:fimbrial biogenesis chaperone n=1 Tax=Stenotrophomonas maltophilia TaxID=40324 RepID=UPI0015592FA3|nr:molecular chaperone [Stenotrophomonas maltophilia]
MTTFLRNAVRCAAVVPLLAASLLAQANVVVEGTRVIYTADMKEASVRIQNAGQVPSLVQVWVDEVGVKADPSTTRAPFVALPPLLRVDSGKSQVLRLRKIGGELPQDRESVFWLNILDVPAAEKRGPGSAQLQISVRNRIKLFYRPQSLAKQPVGGTVEKLEWAVVPHEGGWALQVRNPSAYHVSLIRAEVINGKDSVEAQGIAMMAPLTTQYFALPRHPGASSGSVKFRFASEHGALIEHTAPLRTP